MEAYEELLRLYNGQTAPASFNVSMALIISASFVPTAIKLCESWATVVAIAPL